MSCADFECDDECGVDFDDDWYDDMPAHVKEEPDCYACNDSGMTYPGGRRCRSCAPTWLQHLWWRLTWRIADGWRYRRWPRFGRRRASLSDEPPF